MRHRLQPLPVSYYGSCPLQHWLTARVCRLLIYYKEPKDVLAGKESGRIDLRGCQIKDNLGMREGLTSKESGFTLLETTVTTHRHCSVSHSSLLSPSALGW